jgi:hypothetical protein
MAAVFLDDPLPVLVLRMALAVLFASAAWHKLRARATFQGVLEAYRVLPPALVPVAAPALAGAELAVAAALLVPAGRVAGALGAVALLALYAVAIAVNLWRGRREIDCGCGVSDARQPISEWLLARNALLAAAALSTLRPFAPRALVWVDWLTLVGALVVAACVWTAAHGLAAATARTRAVGARR